MKNYAEKRKCPKEVIEKVVSLVKDEFAYEELLYNIASDTEMALSNIGPPFVLAVDVSQYECGAVLHQR